MGCDIHMFVEARMKDHKDGDRRWVEVSRSLEVTGLGGDFATKTIKELGWYPGRNYDEFSVLADVRNGRGFGGIDTGTGFEPLSPPKGTPVDVSFSVGGHIEDWGIDAHSHSYLTLAELKADDEYWDQMTTLKGVVHKDVIPEDGGPPTGMYAAAVYGNNADEYVEYSWAVTYRESCPYIHKQLIPVLQGLLGYHGLLSLDRADWQNRTDRMTEDDIRIVFFFDN